MLQSQACGGPGWGQRILSLNPTVSASSGTLVGYTSSLCCQMDCNREYKCHLSSVKVLILVMTVLCRTMPAYINHYTDGDTP